jgi:glycosyltransferase involved in cell wall biosynthesis
MSSFPLGKRMPLLWLGRRWMKTWAFRHCSGLTSINQAELKRLFAPQSSDYYGINFSNIPHRHTPNTYDPNIFHPVLRAEALAKTGLDPNKRYILMVARLCYEKGLHYIIDILPELARRYPNIHLLVIGEFVEGTDDFQQILRTKIKELRVDGFITFKPRVEHHEGLVNYYNMAEVFVLPTFMDSFAAVNIEALACGIPVVSTNREEIPHYLKPGLGIVVPEHDQLALLAAVDQVLSGQFRPDPNLRECILSQYDYRYAAANLKSWYEEILNNSNFGKSGSIE